MGIHIKTLTCVAIVTTALILITDNLVNNRSIPAQFFRDTGKRQSIKESDELLISSTTMNPPNFQYDDREYIYKERRSIMSEGCKKINRTLRDKSELASNTSGLLVDRIHSIYYCPIAKVSSTFWKRVLTVIASQGKLTSPFQISLGGVRLGRLSDLSRRELNKLRSKGTSLIITRDPYTRLFSGYVNKIYHSNLMFWRITGRPAVHIIREDNDIVYKTYGFDVTFPEFIKYILYQYETGQSINGHFAPMLRKCDPCSTYFDYIVKFETLKYDAPYLITKWRNELEDVKLRYEDFEGGTILDTAIVHVNFLFTTKKILSEIKFPFIKIMLRTWRDLQIRGYISKYIPFPFKESDVETITKEEYIEAVKTALNIPVNRTEVKLQREEALIQAYQQVSMEDMERLRQYVLQDCMLFGYDDRPAKLFDRSKRVSEDFEYLEGLRK